jgi:hypothetical protein
MGDRNCHAEAEGRATFAGPERSLAALGMTAFLIARALVSPGRILVLIVRTLVSVVRALVLVVRALVLVVGHWFWSFGRWQKIYLLCHFCQRLIQIQRTLSSRA